MNPYECDHGISLLAGCDECFELDEPYRAQEEAEEADGWEARAYSLDAKNREDYLG